MSGYKIEVKYGRKILSRDFDTPELREALTFLRFHFPLKVYTVYRLLFSKSSIGYDYTGLYTWDSMTRRERSTVPQTIRNFKNMRHIIKIIAGYRDTYRDTRSIVKTLIHEHMHAYLQERGDNMTVEREEVECDAVAFAFTGAEPHYENISWTGAEDFYAGCDRVDLIKVRALECCDELGLEYPDWA